jgi:hypothetical protein
MDFVIKTMQDAHYTELVPVMLVNILTILKMVNVKLTDVQHMEQTNNVQLVVLLTILLVDYVKLIIVKNHQMDFVKSVNQDSMFIMELA